MFLFFFIFLILVFIHLFNCDYLFTYLFICIFIAWGHKGPRGIMKEWASVYVRNLWWILFFLFGFIGFIGAYFHCGSVYVMIFFYID